MEGWIESNAGKANQTCRLHGERDTTAKIVEQDQLPHYESPGGSDIYRTPGRVLERLGFSVDSCESGIADAIAVGSTMAA